MVDCEALQSSCHLILGLAKRRYPWSKTEQKAGQVAQFTRLFMVAEGSLSDPGQWQFRYAAGHAGATLYSTG